MNHQDLMRELMQDKEFASTWRETEASFRVATLLISLRAKHRLTQTDLATKAGVKREYIARLESGDANPTVRSLGRILNSLGLELRLEPAEPEEPPLRTRVTVDDDPLTSQRAS